jgi:hypothetical protein
MKNDSNYICKTEGCKNKVVKNNMCERHYYISEGLYEEYKEKNRNWMKTKKSKIYRQKYYEEHKDEIKLYHKNYRLQNKEKLDVHYKNYYQENKKYVIQKSREYYYNNREKIIPKMTEYERNRRQNNIYARLVENLRCRLFIAIKSGKGIKISKSLEYLGAQPKFIKEYIEQQFKPGMSWQNYGMHGWHIDHIIPVSKFDLTNENERKKCFHYTNLQPLWAEENMKKSNKLYGDIKEENKILIKQEC